MTIAIMAAGFVALLSGFSVVELQVGSTSDNAQLTTLARLVTGVIEAEPTATAGQGGLSYVVCASSSSYKTQLSNNAAISAAKGTDQIDLTVAQATSVSGAGSTTPIANCGGSVSDYGVQQITYTLTSAKGNALKRVVYKRWN